MARSVYNVDLDTFVDDRHVFREDGDASFPLDVIVVEYQLAKILGLTYQISLVDHPVHKRGLAVIDVRDERDVPNLLHILLKSCKITDFLWKTEKLQDFFIIVRRLTNRTTRSMSLPKRPYHQLSVLNGITGRQRRPVKFPTWKSRKQ